MYVVTVTERTPTRPEDKDIHTYTVRKDNMFQVAKFLEDAELSWTVWVSVNITKVD